MESNSIQRNYLILTLFNTLSSSFIWGINTLFLLDAGLSNSQAFAANAFFTAGMVVFEIPTGVIADTLGRRTSYLLGSLTLFVTTLIYFFLWKHHAPFWAWAIDSVMIGLGFTFFTGATDAWLVDALNFSGFKDSLEDVFAKGQMVSGLAMLVGATSGGYIAQYTDLGVPYLIRCGVLLISFSISWILMRDLGFTPRKMKNIKNEIKTILIESVDGGIKIPAIRWVMFLSPIMSGVGIYGFYAAQPYLLKLFGSEKAYGIAGIAASLVAATQILGGASVPYVRKIFAKRTSIFATIILGSSIMLCLLGVTHNFWQAICLLGLWGFLTAAMIPVRQAYLNNCIKSEQRATILSFDGLLGSLGGVILQPAFGKTADVWGYAASFLVSGIVQIFALPLVFLARKEKSQADIIT